MISWLLLSTALAASGEATGASVADGKGDRMIADAREWLLNGEPLPYDLDLRLQRLSPEERMRVIVFLRRSGLLTDSGRSAEWILAPAKATEGEE